MVIYTTKETLIKALSERRKKNGQKNKINKIGFVPTMGALHPGHLSLVEKALKENDIVVISIFVNPTQFNNITDLEKYPRNTEKDLSLLNGVNDDLVVYLPQISDIYGDHAVSIHYDFEGLENEMEGKHRKGHFDGVGTVLTKFFEIINPDRAYFGEKDFQQLQIVRKLVQIESIPVEIIGCSIMREENGLAMSSRNERLSPKQKEGATIIFKTLSEVREKFDTHSIEELEKLVVERFLRDPNIELEYFEIVNEKNLKPLKQKKNDINYRAFIAAFLGDVRLIDNMSLN
ncbi:pantoate--beta-alanine ligase [Aequorivita sp. H23M31]|uniref:Pantothenate synthetase n=1 Tax=Aequorivita ciconiae TaxID=2494375 RepID=A0A410G3L8_9FLAO|nr:pantoate--beta-alanine ligase [Aequorivita sp. H23M31]QAA81888.1 pantoate--beta-alanine ligase [Aequorivita sp. H23M31]